jgi:2-amino-4-hydroxy-6-hydroxymethyldihydropteridine diphosphokinase
MTWQYLIAFGSNMRHPRHGPPDRVVAAAIDALDLPVTARSQIIASRPVGPSLRTYANAVVLAETAMTPTELLDHLLALEAHFGRLRRGQRWGKRVLDLDIILWSGGIWASPGLAIPHLAFRDRNFVLGPAAAVAPRWRDPVTGFRLNHLKARLDRRARRP